MEKLSDIERFKERQNIVLKGFDPVSAYGFTQIPNYILKSSGLSFAAIVVYAKLLSYAWHHDRVFPGQEKVAEELCSSQQTVARAIKELSEQKWIEVVRRGLGKTNVYILHCRVIPARKWSRYPYMGIWLLIYDYLDTHRWSSERG